MRKPPRTVGIDGLSVDLDKHPGAYQRYVELSGSGLLPFLSGFYRLGKGVRHSANSMNSAVVHTLASSPWRADKNTGR
jgi:hypothetical protein